MKQRLVTLVAGLCAAVIVTGCSSTPNETTQQSEAQTGKQTEVSVQAKEQTEVSAQTKEQTESAMQLSTEGQEEQPVTEAMKLMAASTEAERNTLASETETEAAVLPETKAETEAVIAPETEVETEAGEAVETETEVLTGSETEAETEAGETVETEAETEAREAVETEAETEAGEAVETEAETEAREAVETEAETEAREAVETEAETEAGETVETEAETEAWEAVETEAETEAREAVETEAETEAREAVETEAETEAWEAAETEAETDTLTADESELETMSETEKAFISLTFAVPETEGDDILVLSGMESYEALTEAETWEETEAETEEETEAETEEETEAETEVETEEETEAEIENKLITLHFASPETETEEQADAGSIEAGSLKKGKALKKGDCIGIVAPASYIENNDFNQAVMFLRSLGYKVKVADSCIQTDRSVVEGDEQRAEALNEMFLDDSVDAILCLRGGYGCSRILDYLDYEMIAEHPKLLMGYSDITALHVALMEKCGIATVHGPMVSSFSDIYSSYVQQLFEKNLNLEVLTGDSVQPENCKIDLDQISFEDMSMDYTVTQFREGITNTDPIGEITLPDGQELTALVPGTAKGRIIGGNLTILASLVGTEYELQADHAILFFEEVGEAAYRIDRLMGQLWENGLFDRVDGILIGEMVNNTDSDECTVSQAIEGYAKLAGKPCITGVPAGHGEDNMFLPFGVMAQMTANEDGTAQLEILEPALE